MKVLLAALCLFSTATTVLSQGQVTGFSLIDAATDQEIRSVTSGDTIDLAVDGSLLSMRADVTGGVGSVRLSLDGTVTKTENVAPYALGGDSSGDYNPVGGLALLGNHIVAATPFSGSGGGGIQGSTTSVSFQVIDTGVSPTPPTPPPTDSTSNTNPPTLAPGIHPDIVQIITVPGANPRSGWSDSYSVGDSCYCESTFDHNIGPILVNTPLGVLSVLEVCDLLGPGPGSANRPKYNDIQCGNGPPNDAGDETDCPGRVDIGPEGCGQIGPTWNFAPFLSTDVLPYPASPQGIVSGELRKWHKITLGFEGPNTSETASPNPFTQYRLDVTFTHPGSGTSYTVAGYYAADGNAANSGATSGNVWLCHFAPDQIGAWSWSASFVQGNNVAQNGGGSPTSFNGASGQLDVANTDKGGKDHRGKGLLEYVGEHHLRFAETDEYFLKVGADAPENLLAYDEFDNTPNNGGRRKSWGPHAGDYNEGDPTWKNGQGKNIIGAINYLSSKGMNAFSFLPMNINGDDKNVFPYISDSSVDRERIDVSKTSQWEVLFKHADKLGLFLHFKTQETENDQLLDGGNLGNERKLYYRELVARFGHHLALNWNLGEENTNTDTQRKQFADYFKQIDPYGHPVVVHTFPGAKNSVYTPLLGYTTFDGVSLQSGKSSVFRDTKEWVQRSATSGRKWVVANDEQGNAQEGILPDANNPTHDDEREEVLWGNIMAGGAGCEYYFGYGYSNSDLTCEDFRSRDTMWDQSRFALLFFKDNAVPFWDMSNDDSIVSSGHALVQSNQDNIVVYLPTATGSLNVDLSSGVYSISWYNPRAGGALQAGSLTSVNSGNNVSLGTAPNSPGKDWVVLLRRNSTPSAPTPTAPLPSPPTPSSHAPTPTPPTPTSPTPVFGSITSFTLVDAASDSDIGPLNENDVVSLSATGIQLSIRANYVGSIGSVGFGLDGNANFQTENFAAYALGGNGGSNYYVVSQLAQTGSHTLTATPYSGSGKSGITGSPVSITFTVIE